MFETFPADRIFSVAYLYTNKESHPTPPYGVWKTHPQPLPTKCGRPTPSPSLRSVEDPPPAPPYEGRGETSVSKIEVSAAW